MGAPRPGRCDGRRRGRRGRMAGTRNALIFGVLICAALVTTSCTSSGGKTHDSTPPTRDSPSSTANSSSNSASPSPSWTPPDYGTAKPAVDAYLTFGDLLDKAFRDPAHVPASTFNKSWAGTDEELFATSL